MIMVSLSHFSSIDSKCLTVFRVLPDQILRFVEETMIYGGDVAFFDTSLQETELGVLDIG
jgi:hypothetical protein